MPNSCVALNCKTGYGNSTAENVSLHRLPKNEDVKKEWLKRLSRKDFSPSENSRVCSKHFTTDCFVTTSGDSNKSRLEKKGGALQRR